MKFSRADWGARPANGGPGPLTRSRVRGIALHWPAMSRPVRGVNAVKTALRGWQNYHMDGNGWSDIAYQVAVDQDGNRYELRGLLNQSGANGGTTVNEEYGAVLLVLAPGEHPTNEMMCEVRAVIAEHRALFPNSRRVVGHGDIRPGGTECPGPIVQRLVNIGAFNTANAPEPEDDMPTPRDLLDEPLNIHDPKGLLETRNVTVGEALTAFVVNLTSGKRAAKKYLDQARKSKA